MGVIKIFLQFPRKTPSILNVCICFNQFLKSFESNRKATILHFLFLGVLMLSLQEVKEKHFFCRIVSNFPQSSNIWEAQVIISLHHSTVDKELKNK